MTVLLLCVVDEGILRDLMGSEVEFPNEVVVGLLTAVVDLLQFTVFDLDALYVGCCLIDVHLLSHNLRH